MRVTPKQTEIEIPPGRSLKLESDAACVVNSAGTPEAVGLAKAQNNARKNFLHRGWCKCVLTLLESIYLFENCHQI
jgi:hypothetical protein